MTPEDAENENEQLIRAFRLCFGSPAGQEVLKDLAPFCRAAGSCAVPGDHDTTMLLLGRNQVWLRIQTFMNLTPREVLMLRTGKTNIQPEGETP